MATGRVEQNGLKKTTILENNTAKIYEPGDELPITISADKFKYLIVTYLYGLTGFEYNRIVSVPTGRVNILDTIEDDVWSCLFVNPNGVIALNTNGSVSGVYIKRIVGIN